MLSVMETLILETDTLQKAIASKENIKFFWVR